MTLKNLILVALSRVVILEIQTWMVNQISWHQNTFKKKKNITPNLFSKNQTNLRNPAKWAPFFKWAVLMSLSQLFPQITAQFRSRRHPGRHLVMAEIRRETPVEVGSFIPFFIGFQKHPRWCRSSAIKSMNDVFFSMFPSKNEWTPKL